MYKLANSFILQFQAIELEIDSYSGLVKEMGTTADGLIKTKHPQSKMIKERQQVAINLYELMRMLLLFIMLKISLNIKYYSGWVYIQFSLKNFQLSQNDL